jgi:hypothetical protein
MTDIEQPAEQPIEQSSDESPEQPVDPKTVTVRGKAHGTLNLFGGPPKRNDDR